MAIYARERPCGGDALTSTIVVLSTNVRGAGGAAWAESKYANTPAATTAEEA
jgi:hypothetical protein